MKTEWEEFKQIWAKDGFGQPRTAASKVALIIYCIPVAIAILCLVAWYGLVDMFGKR